MKSFDKLIFTLYLLVFMGIMYNSTVYTTQVEENRLEAIRQAVIDEQQAVIDEAAREYSLRQEAAIEAAKYHGLVKHDGNPETNLFDLKLDAANSLDTDNDNFQYEWSQIGGNPLDIASTDSKILYLQAPPGEYEFQLDVTDSYGASTSNSQIVVIAEEPNVAPKASFSIKNESKGVYFDDGPSWQTIPDSVKVFQATNKLTTDGLWGPASQKRFLKIASDKKAKEMDKAKVDKAKADNAKVDNAKVDKAKVDKAKVDKAKADKAKVMKKYNEKLAKIEAEIRNVSGFGAAGKRRTLEAKKAAHIETKPK